MIIAGSTLIEQSKKKSKGPTATQAQGRRKTKRD